MGSGLRWTTTPSPTTGRSDNYPVRQRRWCADGEPIRKMTAGGFELSHLKQLYNCMDAVIKDGF